MGRTVSYSSSINVNKSDYLGWCDIPDMHTKQVSSDSRVGELTNQSKRLFRRGPLRSRSYVNMVFKK